MELKYPPLCSPILRYINPAEVPATTTIITSLIVSNRISIAIRLSPPVRVAVIFATTSFYTSGQIAMAASAVMQSIPASSATRGVHKTPTNRLLPAAVRPCSRSTASFRVRCTAEVFPWLFHFPCDRLHFYFCDRII